MIVVAHIDPDGDSMWADSYDENYPKSSELVNDLIPYIDKNYDTEATKNSRAIAGFSMGGFGAAMTIFKYPHLFFSLTIFDGAMHDWETLVVNRKGIFAFSFF